MKSRILLLQVFLAGWFVLSPVVVAQQGSQGSGAASAPATVTPPPAAPSIPMITTPRENRMPEIPSTPEIIFIAGTVVQEDGNPPPFGTVIELDCGNTISREATVNNEGHFGFQVGSNNRIGRVAADASDPIGKDVFDTSLSAQSLSGSGFSASMRTTPLAIQLLRCDVRAQHPGYRSTSVRMRAGAISGYTEVDTILLYRVEKIKGTSVSVTSLAAPREAKRAVAQAAKALKKGNADEAEKLLKASLELHPRNAEALCMLGQVYQIKRRDHEARDFYMRSISADSLYINPYLRLARMALMEEAWKAAAGFSDKAVELDPVGFPEAYYFSALAYFNLKDYEASERSARKGLRVDLGKQHPRLHLVRANALSAMKDSQGSMDAMRDYLKDAPKGEEAPAVRSRLEEKEKLAKAERKPE